MTLKKKILIGYGVAFVLMGLVVAWAVTNLVSLGKATDAILSENYRSILAAENMVDALERQDSGVLLIFLGDSEKGSASSGKTRPYFSNGWPEQRTTSRSRARRSLSNPSRLIMRSTDKSFPH